MLKFDIIMIISIYGLLTVDCGGYRGERSDLTEVKYSDHSHHSPKLAKPLKLPKFITAQL